MLIISLIHCPSIYIILKLYVQSNIIRFLIVIPINLIINLPISPTRNVDNY